MADSVTVTPEFVCRASGTQAVTVTARPRMLQVDLDSVKLGVPDSGILHPYGQDLEFELTVGLKTYVSVSKSGAGWYCRLTTDLEMVDDTYRTCTHCISADSAVFLSS